MDILVCVCGEDSNGKGAGETVVSPWRKLLKPLGFRKFCSASWRTQNFVRILPVPAFVRLKTLGF